MEQVVAYAVVWTTTALVSWLIFRGLIDQQQNSPLSFGRLERGGPGVQFGFAGLQGPRPTMEDAHVCDRVDSGLLLGVSDGHNGDRASHFAARHIGAELATQLRVLGKTDKLNERTENSSKSEKSHGNKKVLPESSTL